MRLVFRAVLVPNRGEVAVRVLRTLRRLGIRGIVAVSTPDRLGMAARLADDVVVLPGVTPAETYLDVRAVIEAARRAGADAIHPGWGFLAESPALAEACREAGIVFIGPPPGVLRALGDKEAARSLAARLGIPVAEAAQGDTIEELVARARSLERPLMVKARAGGGGRGMRIVRDGDELESVLRAASREAASAFGDGRLLVERLIESAHHVEVQIAADGAGRVLHLGERDCSVQRRHQKVVEESPSPVVDDRLRAALCSAAVRLAEAVGYAGLGTVEFLVGPPGPDGDRPFYFLEVNPRLQVEHPVTELRTGLDLAELQLEVAAGAPLRLRQTDVRLEGHAIECRLNAEDPSRDFRPSSGRLGEFELCACAQGARWDAGYEAGDEVPLLYDSLLAKVVVHASDREAALTAMRRALGAVHADGVSTNLQLLRGILRSPVFEAGEATTSWLESELEPVLERGRTPAFVWEEARIAVAGGALGMCAEPIAPWRQRPRWFGAGSLAVWLSDGCEVRELRYGEEWARPRTRSSGCTQEGCVQVEEWCLRVVAPPPLPRRGGAEAGAHEAITAPLAGRVIEVHAEEGRMVQPGELLVLLEAMKMEHRVVATTAGRVAAVLVAPGEIVSEGQVLVELE